MKRKQIIRLTESKLRRLIREAIEQANEDDVEDFVESVDYKELLKRGETECGDFFIYIERGHAIWEFIVYNPDENCKGSCRVGLSGGDIEEECRYGVQCAYKKYLDKLNRRIVGKSVND